MLIVLLKLVACYMYDGLRFARAGHLFGSPFRSRAAAKAHLLRLSHSLEKGMALSTPRAGFGSKLTTCLVSDMESYVRRYGPDELTNCVLGIVEALLAYHKDRGVEWPELERNTVAMRVRHAGLICSYMAPVGTVKIQRQQIVMAAPVDPEAFFNLRRSVRQFSDIPISSEEIERAVKMAFRAPSVCNRQGAKLYVYTDSADRERVLKFQDGNSGFGDHASVVFVVTTDMSVFYKNGERNQAFVDGGLFAMSLAMSLHAIGLGACMLNWAVGPRKDRPMRRALGIPDNEVVITLLVAGHLHPEFSVAASPRRPLNEVLVWNRTGVS